MDGELRDNVITLSYSNDLQRWTAIINGTKYNFYGVNPYMMRKLGQFIKHNNKKKFFELLRTFEYENLSKPQNNQDKGGDAGKQLSMFEADLRETVRSSLRQNLIDNS